MQICLYVGNSVLFDKLFIRKYFRNYCIILHTSAALSLIHNDILYAGNRDQFVFNFFGVNIFTVRKNDKIFLSARDIEYSVLSQFAVISRSEVAFLINRFGSCFIVFIISEHYVGTLYADLAFPVLVGIDDFNIIHIKYCANASFYDMTTSVYRYERSALGNTVSVKNGNSHSFKELNDILIYWSTSCYDRFDLSSKSISYLGKELLSHINKAEACFSCNVADLQHIVHKLILAFTLKICFNSSIEGFKIQRN